MKKFLDKKQWMMLSLVAALGVAVYLNYYFTNSPVLTTGADSGTDSTVSEIKDTPLGEAAFVNAGSVVADNQEKKQDGDQTSETASSEDTDAGAAAGDDYFDKARASRTAAREESVRLLEETLGRVQATAEEKAAATKQATAIADNILQESNIENLILAKGFSDCVVFIDGDHCNVVVQAADLQQQESVQILEIVLSQSDIVAANVQITTRAGE